MRATMFFSCCLAGVTAAENRVDWKVNRTERHGLQNLRFGKNGSTVVSLTCAARSSIDEPPVVTVVSNASFTLSVSYQGGRAERVVPEGTTTWTVEAVSGAKTGLLRHYRSANANGLLLQSFAGRRVYATRRPVALYTLKGELIGSVDRSAMGGPAGVVHYREFDAKDAL